MDFDTYKPALLAWVEGYGGTTAKPLAAIWEREKRSWVSKARALLRVHSTRGVGVDQVHWEQDTDLAAGSDLVPTVQGQRQFMLSIMVETRDQTAGGAAQWFLERLRTSLKLPPVQAAFRAAGLAFATSSPVINLDEVVQDRLESHAVLDVLFNATAELSAPTGDADSYVESAETTAEFDKGDGNTVGWADEEMP